MAKSFDFLGFQTGFVFEVELMIDSEILDTFSFQESTAGVSTQSVQRFAKGISVSEGGKGSTDGSP
jgi:hypothetical protein